MIEIFLAVSGNAEATMWVHSSFWNVPFPVQERGENVLIFWPGVPEKYMRCFEASSLRCGRLTFRGVDNLVPGVSRYLMQKIPDVFFSDAAKFW